MIAIALSKQQALDANPAAIQQINFTENLKNNGVINIFHHWRSKRHCFRFFKRNSESILIWFFALI